MALKVKKVHPSWILNDPELIKMLEESHAGGHVRLTEEQARRVEIANDFLGVKNPAVDPILGFPWLFVVGMLVVNALSFGVGFVLGGLLW